MKIAIISTGDELLRGKIADTNGAWIASKLDERGYMVDRMITVGDDPDALSALFKEAFSEFSLVIVGGGLGPTDDDLTAGAAARAMESTITRSKKAEAQVRAAFQRIQRPMVDINLKQADLPRDCTVLENSSGTAPGFSIDTTGGTAFFFPGVPRELKPMFEKYVLPTLPGRGSATHRSVFKSFGRGESDIQAALKPIVAAFPGVGWAYRSSFPEIGVTVTAPDEETLNRVGDEVRRTLGKNIFAEEDIKLPAALGKALLERGYTLATAESCTGGLIGHSITEVAGSSEYYRGGIVAYDNDVKENTLGVDQAVLEKDGAVSEPVVRAMAEGVRASLKADVGVAVSGIAGPGGGTKEKPVGLVHFAVAHPNGAHACRVEHLKRIFHGFDRTRVKQISAWVAMWMAFRALQEDE